MTTRQTTQATEGAIWTRVLQSGNKRHSLQSARSLLRLDFTADDKTRMHELAAKARAGTLSAAEQAEIRAYERVGNLLAMLQSKARQRLKNASSNGSAH